MEDTGYERETNNYKYIPPQMGNETGPIHLIEQRLSTLENLVADPVEKIMSEKSSLS